MTDWWWVPGMELEEDGKYEEALGWAMCFWFPCHHGIRIPSGGEVRFPLGDGERAICTLCQWDCPNDRVTVEYNIERG